MLRINDLSKKYRKPPDTVIRALDGVSLDIEQGEFVMVQGPSGSGKTTLLLSAGGLLPPSAGTVEIHGRDLYRMSQAARARLRAGEIGFVFQQFYLVSYLNVLENVLTPSLALPDQQALIRARELIDHFKLTDRIAHFPSELSTGERQRVGLARALLNKPRLLLADEPTGNLDQDNTGIVLGYFAEFARSGGTVLMVTHGLAAAEYSHRTVHLEAGKLLDRTEPESQT